MSATLNGNSAAQELRETPVKTELSKQPKGETKALNPTRVFVDKDRLAKLWFGIAVLVIIGAAVDRYYLVSTLKQRERVVILDPAGTYYLSPIFDFMEAKDLHAQQTSLATSAFLERNPETFDNPELLKQIFLKEAHQRAVAQLETEAQEFKAKQIHQKAEIAKVDILQTRENYVLTQATGQLIRAGIFNGKSFTEAIPFKVSFKMQRNPDMTKNGRFPTAVWAFKYEPQR